MKFLKITGRFLADLLFFILGLLTTSYRDKQFVRWGGWRKA